MKRYRHDPKVCPWCRKEVKETPLDPQTGLPLEFICEDCGLPVYFCSLTCWRRAHIFLLKEEGLTGKQARRELLTRFGNPLSPPD